VELMRLASQREQSVAGGVGILRLGEYLPVECECLLGPDDKRSGQPRAYLLGLHLREQLGDIARIPLVVVLKERFMDRRLVHIRLYDPKGNPHSCEQLPPALRLRCEHHVALAQTLDETCSILHHHWILSCPFVRASASASWLLPSAVGQRWDSEGDSC
jgi:hypothetical protein